MSRIPNTRREIAPLDVPWLQHEHFPATKEACSSSDGLAAASKNSAVKVVQELKRGRAHVDKQLAQLDTQLLAITNYLDGRSSSMFPPHLVMYVEENQDVKMSLATVAGKTGGYFSSDLLPPPTTAMVEDDIASDIPCTTIGLWKYLYAYSFFKTITPEDMKQALLLEDIPVVCSVDPNTLFEEDMESTEEARTGDNSLDFEQLEEKLDSDKAFPQDLDDVLKERLVASLNPVEKPPPLKEHEALPTSLPFPQSENGDFSSEVQQTTKLSSSAHSVDQGSWNPKGVTHVLRNVGLVEASDKELTRRTLSSPKDDEVSQEIRLLQRQLRACIGHTNETKRKLRKKMDESKPWLSQKKEEDNSTINRYFTMWQTKKVRLYLLYCCIRPHQQWRSGFVPPIPWALAVEVEEVVEEVVEAHR
ncbi:hypothetical protein BBJ29_001599 [Phytophthora kernoviae]|uniref:Uncharacterized protein n=1 Tax=Phytophthora kernoviae TaxID=325452 RepID=A0A3F2RWB5_9STRA|nr:hypothetical protein BBJ29_001599 [Phytophthora kernoviae]RLN65507.1 hypothetical protein BBP00_00002805 [Phytophthora kernoviae]